MDNQTLIKLKVNNIMRIKAVEITVEGKAVIIGGKNRAGKSSLLQSIAMLFGGGRAVPDKPIREGEDRGSIVGETEDLIIVKKFDKTKKTLVELKVMSKELGELSSPQRILDKLYNALTFDPLEFLNAKPDKQSAILQKLAGLDFTEHDALRKSIYDERTKVNGKLDDAEMVFASAPFHSDAPDEEVSLEALLKEMRVIQEDNDRLKDRRFELSVLKNNLTTKRVMLETSKENLDTAQLNLQRAQERVNSAKEDFGIASGEVEKAAQAIDTFGEIPEDQSTDEIREKIKNTEGLNNKLKDNKRKEEKKKIYVDLEEKSTTLKSQLKEMDDKKKNEIHSASFPVEGLSFDETGVMFCGIPIDQCSQEEQITIGVGMSAAMNPKLRIALIKGGSSLDEERLKLVVEESHKRKIIPWIERVGEGDECSVIIEDGSIKE
jgi:hypothetical protein